jgi:hypothetical protein
MYYLLQIQYLYYQFIYFRILSILREIKINKNQNMCKLVAYIITEKALA